MEDFLVVGADVNDISIEKMKDKSAKKLFLKPTFIYQCNTDIKPELCNKRRDILLRASYPISLGSTFTITPSILPIYHMGDDEFTNALGEVETIVDSKGLTLNANLFIDFAINNTNKISLSFAAPLVTRKVRPDGLTRKYVAGLEYAVRF